MIKLSEYGYKILQIESYRLQLVIWYAAFAPIHLKMIKRQN